VSVLVVVVVVMVWVRVKIVSGSGGSSSGSSTVVAAAVYLSDRSSVQSPHKYTFWGSHSDYFWTFNSSQMLGCIIVQEFRKFRTVTALKAT